MHKQLTLIVYVISKTPFSASESTFVLLKEINKVQKRSFDLIGSNSNQDYHRILWGYQPLLQLAVKTALHPENWGKGGNPQGASKLPAFLILNAQVREGEGI